MRDSTMIAAKTPKKRAASTVAGRGRRTAVTMEATASSTKMSCVVQATSSSALKASSPVVPPSERVTYPGHARIAILT